MMAVDMGLPPAAVPVKKFFEKPSRSVFLAGSSDFDGIIFMLDWVCAYKHILTYYTIYVKYMAGVVRCAQNCGLEGCKSKIQLKPSLSKHFFPIPPSHPLV
jgi:hypothetical protein